MKKTVVLASLVVILGVGILLTYCIGQIRVNAGLEEEITKKKQALLMLQGQQNRLSELEKQSKDLDTQEALILRRVPANEKQPLAFIKTLMRQAARTGLKDITIDVSDESLPLDDGFVPTRLEINFQGDYSAFISFFEELMNTERLFTVEMLKIERDENYLPAQKIYLQLLIYTLSR